MQEERISSVFIQNYISNIPSFIFILGCGDATSAWSGPRWGILFLRLGEGVLFCERIRGFGVMNKCKKMRHSTKNTLITT